MTENNKDEKMNVENEMEKEQPQELNAENLEQVTGGFSMDYFKKIVKPKNA